MNTSRYNNMNFETHQSVLTKSEALLGYYLKTENKETKKHIRDNYNKILNNNTIVIF